MWRDTISSQLLSGAVTLNVSRYHCLLVSVLVTALDSVSQAVCLKQSILVSQVNMTSHDLRTSPQQ